MLAMHRSLVIVALAAALLMVPATLLAQDRGPGADRGTAATPAPMASPAAPSPRLDLAAMALDTLDMPAEFQLAFETYYDFDAIMSLMVGETIERSTMEATGLTWYYQSSYTTPAGETGLRSYLEEFTSEEGAIAGFELLENEATFVPEAAFTDEPAPELGDGPAEITVGSFASAVPETGPDSIDITFRVGRIVAGVGMETSPGVSIDRELGMQLANRLYERIAAVIEDEAIPAIDTTLPIRYVGLGPVWFTTNEGYWTIPDLYGPDVAPTIVDGFQSGYFRASTYDPNAAGGFPMPRVAIEVAEFATESAALFLVSDMSNLRPVMQSFTTVTIPTIPGSSVTFAWEFPNQFIEGATTDSMRIVMLVGAAVVTVDVQGNGFAETAREAAIAIATAQVACLAAEGSCETTSMPDDLFVAPTPSTPSDPVG